MFSNLCLDLINEKNKMSNKLPIRRTSSDEFKQNEEETNEFNRSETQVAKEEFDQLRDELNSSSQSIITPEMIFNSMVNKDQQLNKCLHRINSM